MRNAALYAAGLTLGALNTVRHRRQGYVNPRAYTPSDVDRTIQHAMRIVADLERHGASWEDRRVLEIGPGSDLATGAIMLARGAASYDAVDLFDNRWQTAEGLYERLSTEVGTFDVDRLKFTQTGFPGLPGLSGSFDVIVSNACLEHVENPHALFVRLRDLAAPGCVGVHCIDARTHMRWFRDHDTLNILRYPDFLYNRLLTFPGAPNRLRGSDYARLASEAGWRDVEVVPQQVVALQDTRVARRWRDYPDLGVVTFGLVTR